MRSVKVFYSNIQSCAINNGTASDYLMLERGVRQGDLLSSYLFILAVETLAIAIREKDDIKRIREWRDKSTNNMRIIQQQRFQI